MGLFDGPPLVCPSNPHCSQWAETYLDYCLGSPKDWASLLLGALSVLSWGVAEIPQIMTNYKQKSTEGLSISFLLTWILGDLFNLFGCLLEPTTLPTQYYMAVLYTITTLVLTSQSVYYLHIYPRLLARREGLLNAGPTINQYMDMSNESYGDSLVDEKQGKHCDSRGNGFNDFKGVSFPSSPIPVTPPVLPRYGSHGGELYYMSARYLSQGRTPTTGSYIAQAVSQERTAPISIHRKHFVEEPLLSGRVSTQSAPSNTKSMLCVISATTFFVSSIGLHFSMNTKDESMVEKPPGFVIQVGRKLLQNDTILVRHGVGGINGIGTILGWAMAVIYMGGRLPQICLNVKRGHVEGLNPLMFIFALFGNGTYVASILVNSTEWSKISANLPWLVDAGGCILLDTCILFQFIYFYYWKSKKLNVNSEDFSAS